MTRTLVRLPVGLALATAFLPLVADAAMEAEGNARDGIRLKVDSRFRLAEPVRSPLSLRLERVLREDLGGAAAMPLPDRLAGDAAGSPEAGISLRLERRLAPSRTELNKLRLRMEPALADRRAGVMAPGVEPAGGLAQGTPGGAPTAVGPEALLPYLVATPALPDERGAPSGAVLVAPELVSPDLATPSTAGPETAGPVAVAPVQTGVAEAGRRWGLAPIRWGGRLSEDLRWTEGDQQPSQFGATTAVTLRASSYLRQPWIAMVNGSMTLAVNSEENESEGAYSNDATTVTGSLGLSLFAYSRFPFVGSIEVSDSRTNGDFTTSDYSSTRISLRQEYRPPRGNDRYNATYDRSVLEGAAYGNDTVDSLSLGFTRIGNNQVWLAEGTLSQNERDQTGDQTTYLRASLRHSWRPNAPYAVESLASIDDREVSYGNFSESFDNHSRFVQLSSNFTWQPRTEKPLIITGGLRFFGVQGSESADMTNLVNANAAANYTLNRNTSLAAGISLSHADSEGSGGDVVTWTGNASYHSDRIRWGSLGYGWHTGASMTGQWSDANETQTLGAYLGHNLSKLWPMSESSSVNLDLGQDLSASFGSGEGVETTQTLNHSASLFWRFQPVDSAVGYIGFSGTDSRTQGDSENNFQMLNFQANGQVNVSRYSTLNANITLQQTRQETDLTEPEDEDWQDTAYGSVSFSHFRFLGVRNLRYTLQAYVNTLGIDNSRQLGNVDAPHDRLQKSLDQRLDYRIGRLDVQLAHRLVETDGLSTSALWLRIGRDFGDY